MAATPFDLRGDCTWGWEVGGVAVQKCEPMNLRRKFMIKSTLPGNPEGHLQSIPSLPGGRFEDRPRPVHFRLELHVRRLRYFMDLLESGYRYALLPDPLPLSLRAERIALGIDLPELDTVPLWSVTRADGAVAIPFVEFIVTQICRTLETIADEAGLAGTAAGEDLVLARGTLRRILEQGSPGSATAAPDLPRLGDIFLPRDLLDEVCGPEGLLRTIAGQCEMLLAAEPVRRGH